LATYQETMLKSYRSVADAGASFGGSLTELRLAASNSYLTLAEFTNVIKTNSTTLAKMGGTVTEGARAFAVLQNSIMSGKIGDQLLSLGYSSEEVGNGMLGFITATGGRSKTELANTAALTEATGQYLTELDKLSEFSGISRKQQEEEMKKAASQAAYQRALSKLSEDQRARAAVGLQAAINSGIPGAVEAFQSKIAGLPPMTDDARKFTGMFGEAADGVNQMADAALDTKGTMDQVEQGFGNFNQGIVEQVDALGTAGDAMTFSNKLMNAASLNATNLIKKGADTAAGTINLFHEITKDQAERNSSQAKQAAESEQAIKQMGQSILNNLLPIIADLLTPLNYLVQGFGYLVSSLGKSRILFDGLAIALGAVVTGLIAYKAYIGVQNLTNAFTAARGGRGGIGGVARGLAGVLTKRDGQSPGTALYVEVVGGGGGAGGVIEDLLGGGGEGKSSTRTAREAKANQLRSRKLGLGKNFLKYASKLKGVAGVGTVLGGLEAGGEVLDIEKQVEAGTITKQEARKKEGGIAGGLAGGAAGGWGGAAAGAAIGTMIFPGVGTAIGGLIGGIGGGFLGDKIGKIAGEFVGDKLSSENKSTDPAQPSSSGNSMDPEHKALMNKQLEILEQQRLLQEKQLQHLDDINDNTEGKKSWLWGH